MGSPFLGQIVLFAGSYAPARWQFCDGRTLATEDYPALYSVIGNIYGGDERLFALPDLRGRVPIGAGQGRQLMPRPLGQQGGTELVKLTGSTVPRHTHTVNAALFATTSTADHTMIWGGSADDGVPLFSENPDTGFSQKAISSSGGSLGHENMAPFMALNYIICTLGLMPT